MLTERLSLYETHKKRAQIYAERDFKAGGPCNPKRHGAKPGSAWETWYTDRYDELAGAPNPDPQRA